MNNNAMQFLFGDRELLLKKSDLFSASVDVIVNPANGGLSHGGGVAAKFVELGGEIIQDESDQFINEHGQLESGMVAITTAGNLPYKAALHAVGPRMGEGDEQNKLRRAVSNCLKLCSMHDWESIAFPAISSGVFSVPIDIVAEAFFHAITSFWDARIDGAPNKIVICLTDNNFQPFFNAFRNVSMVPENETFQENSISKQEDEQIIETGEVSLNEEDISVLENDDVNDWFK